MIEGGGGGGGRKGTHLLPDRLGNAREGLLKKGLADRLLGLVAVLRRLFGVRKTMQGTEKNKGSVHVSAKKNRQVHRAAA